MRYINFNGTIQNENEPMIHSWNRAFRYGDGFFESMVYYDGKIPFIDDHWNRLQTAAELLSLQLPDSFTKKFWNKAAVELTAMNGIGKHAYIRTEIFRDGKGRYTPEDLGAGFLIEADEIPGELFRLNEEGISLGLFTAAQKPADRLGNFKTTSAMIYVLASIHKTNARLDDCLLLNSRSNICDATRSNVFVVKESFLTTPALSEGCVDGVMRKQIIRLASDSGIEVRQTVLEPEMLRTAEEVFLTNAISGITWVANYGKTQFSNKTASLLSQKLRELVAKQ